MRSNFNKLLITAAVSAACQPVLAADPVPIQNPPAVTISGFGTIGFAQTNTDDATFTTGSQPNGATKTGDFGPDTKAGIQLDSKFNSDFSATLQVFSKQNAVGSYSPDVEWAFAKLRLTEGLDLRMGRIGAPFFMVSDFRNVGYTNTTLRTPTDVYGLVQNRNFDGGDLLYKADIGSSTLTSQLWLGRSSDRFSQNAQGDQDIYLHQIEGINFTLETGPLTLRYGTMRTNVSLTESGTASFLGLTGGLQQLGKLPGLADLGVAGSQLPLVDSRATFSGLGAILDLDKVIVNAEYVRRTSDSTAITSNNAWYTTLGYRIDTFTPYVGYSTRSQTSTTAYSVPAAVALYPLQVQGTAVALIAGANGVVHSTDDKTTSIGVRWDAWKNWDIKAEYAQIKVPAGSSGVLTVNNPTGVFATDTKVNVLSVAVDFVF